MIERYLLQVIGVLIVGEFVDSIVAKRDHTVLNRYFLSKFINSIVFGYFLLIIPMLIGGIFFAEHKVLDNVVYTYFGISMALALRKFILTALKLRKYKTELYYEPLHKWLYYVILLNMIGYFILFISIPERGWDALNIYLPNGYYFYFFDKIVAGLNPLSFFPTFKPPVNTLLITYSLYVAKGMYAYLHPYVFLLGSVAVTYEICFLLTNNKIPSFISAIIIMVLPFTFFLVAEFALYQELPIMFFGGVSFYYMLQLSIKPKDHPNYNLFKLGFILSFSLAVLSKISSFAILYVIFISLDLEGNMKKIQQGSLVLITLYLIQRAVFQIYFGLGFVILAIGLLLFYFISKQKSNLNIKSKDFFMLSAIPLMIGIAWIIFSLQIQQVGDFLLHRYVYNGDSQIAWTFPTFPITQIFVENGMRTSFASTVLFVLTGASFAPNLLFFKLDGLRKYKENQFLIRWFFGYLLIAFGYYAHISARYLVPIMIPLSILIGKSIYSLISRFNLSDIQKFIIICVIVATTYLFYLPILPVYTLKDGIFLVFYYYHRSQITILAIMTILTVMMVKFMTSKTLRRTKAKKWYSIFILITIIPTLFMPIGLAIYVHQTPGLEPNNVASFYYRPNYQELVTYIKGTQLGAKDLIIDVNIPGLAYFLNHPVLDIFLLQSDTGLNLNFRNQNITQAANMVKNIQYRSFNFQTKMIIVQNTTHYFYRDFVNNYQNLSIIQLIHYNAFRLTYFNPEFRVYFLVNSTLLPTSPNQ